MSNTTLRCLRRTSTALILIIIASSLALSGALVDLSPLAGTGPGGPAPLEEEGAGESSEDGEADLGPLTVTRLAFPLAQLFQSAGARLFCRPGCRPVLPHPPQAQLAG